MALHPCCMMQKMVDVRKGWKELQSESFEPQKHLNIKGTLNSFMCQGLATADTE
jgi:hypothetical protein